MKEDFFIRKKNWLRDLSNLTCPDSGNLRRRLLEWLTWKLSAPSSQRPKRAKRHLSSASSPWSTLPRSTSSIRSLQNKRVRRQRRRRGEIMTSSIVICTTTYTHLSSHNIISCSVYSPERSRRRVMCTTRRSSSRQLMPRRTKRWSSANLSWISFAPR